MPKICANCGTQNPDTMMFCMKCGQALPTSQPGQAPPPQIQQPQPYTQPQTPPPYIPPAAPPGYAPPQQYIPPQTQPCNPPPQEPYVPPQTQQSPYNPPQTPQPSYSPPQQQPVQPGPQYQPAQPYAQQYQPTQPQYAGQPMGAPKKGLPTAAKILIPVVAVVVVIALIVVIALSAAGGAVSKIAKADYYTLGSDRIPSVRLALNEDRKVTGSNTSASNGVTTQTIEYQVDGTRQRLDMSDYQQYLRDEDDFIVVGDGIDFTGPRGSGELARESVDRGYVIDVAIDYDTKGYTITITKDRRTLTVDSSSSAVSSSEPAPSSSEEASSEESSRAPSSSKAPNSSKPKPSSSSKASSASTDGGTSTVTPAAGWTDTTTNGLHAYVNSDGASLMILTMNWAENADTPEAFVSEFEDQLKGKYSDAVFDDVSSGNVNGYDALAVPGALQGMKVLYMFLFDGDSAYIIRCMAPEAAFSAAQDDFETMINSFALK